MIFSHFALDSNVFRNQDFINYLILYSEDFKIKLPSIVQLEVGYYYRFKGISWDKFLEDIGKFNCKLIPWGKFQNSNIIEAAFQNRTLLPFKHHFRDYIIGIECENVVDRLITYNVSHFAWMDKIESITPEDFIEIHQLSLKNTSN
ncbi:MAG: hypothetical protein ACTSVU_07110 [Promethearchaeota archaeon]